MPLNWPQSVNSSVNHEYEDSSEEFLEGAFDPAGHREVIKSPRVARCIKPEALNKTEQEFTKVYVEGIETRNPK